MFKYAAALALIGCVQAAVPVTNPSATKANYPVPEATSDQRFILKLLSQTPSSLVDSDGIPVETSVEFLVYAEDMKKAFVVNTPGRRIDVFSIKADGSAEAAGTFETTNEPNSIYYNKEDKVIAIAVQAEDSVFNTANGKLMFVDAATLELIHEVETGAPLPDHVSWGPGYRCAYSANEAEAPDTDGDDRAGGVTQVCASNFKDKATYTVAHSNLTNLDDDTIKLLVDSAGMHVSSASRPIKVQLEPEYITYGTPDSNGKYELYVICQESNLFLVYEGNTDGSVLISSLPVRIMPLGFVDHSVEGNGFDCLNNNQVAIAPRASKGIFQPDTIMMKRFNGVDYIVTANEGDKAENGESTVKGSALGLAGDLASFKFAKLGTSTTSATEAFSYGARSFAMFNAATGQLVFHSGDNFEKMSAKYAARFFNSEAQLANGTDVNYTPANNEQRSDSKGPEPESLAMGTIGSTDLLFVGLERPGLIAIYDMTDALNPEFHSINGACSLEDSCEKNYLSDPEAIAFVGAADSPTGKPLLLAAGSVSGKLFVFEVLLKKINNPSDLELAARQTSSAPTTAPTTAPTKKEAEVTKTPSQSSPILAAPLAMLLVGLLVAL